MSSYAEDRVTREPSESLQNSLVQGQNVMPFYLILDQSGSMQQDLGTLSQKVQELIVELRKDPIADDVALLSIISFGSSAQVTLPLTRLTLAPPIGQLSNLGGTSFSSAWKTYDQAVRSDYQQIKAKGASMHRPCVFFLTDGEPFDAGKDVSGVMEFRRVFNQLQGQGAIPYWPYVVAFGFRDATQAVLEQIAYPDFGKKRGKWYNAKNDDISLVLEQIKTMLYSTVIATSKSSTTGEPKILIEDPADMSNLDAGEAEPVDRPF